MKVVINRGLLWIVGFGNTLGAICDDVVDQITLSLDAAEKQGGIKPDQVVRLNGGPFDVVAAIFQAYYGQERAIVLIKYTQKQPSMSAAVSALKSGG